MAFINDTNSREIQQVYLNFYQNLARHKPKTLDCKWNDDDSEETQDEETQDQKKSHRSDPKQNNYSSDKQGQNHSSQSNNLTSSSSQNNPNSSNSSQISLDKKKEQLKSKTTDSLLFQVTQNGKFVDEIELNQDGIKSQQSTDYSERLLAQIEILQSLPEGTIIPTAPSIQVQSVEKQGDKTRERSILLSTDQQGKITKNTLTPSPQKTGTQVIHEQLSSLGDPSVVQYLENLIDNSVNERLNSLYPNLQSQREQDSHNVKWWQQLLQKGRQIFSHFTKEHQHKQVAKKLYYLFSKNVQFGENRFSQNGYTVLRQPKGEQYRYTVFNSNNQPVLAFDVNQQQRLSIVDNQLSLDDSKNLLNLGKYSINSSQQQQNLQNPALMTRANLSDLL